MDPMRLPADTPSLKREYTLILLSTTIVNDNLSCYQIGRGYTTCKMVEVVWTFELGQHLHLHAILHATYTENAKYLVAIEVLYHYSLWMHYLVTKEETPTAAFLNLQSSLDLKAGTFKDVLSNVWKDLQLFHTFCALL